MEQESREKKQATGEDAAPLSDSGALAPSRLILILVAISMSVFISALDLTITATAIPRITDEFHSLADVGWYGSAMFLSVAGMQRVFGKAYTFFSLKSVFLCAIFWFEVGSLICAFAPTSTALIVGRAVQGVGGAGIISGAYIILGFTVAPRLFGLYAGVISAVYGIASIAGPLVGGALTDSATWRWCFYINLPIGGASAVVIVLFFNTPAAAMPRQATAFEKLLHMDLPGTVTLLGSFVCLILALQKGGIAEPWGSSVVIGTLVGFAVLLALFIATQIWQGDRGIMPPRIVRQRTVYLIMAYQVLNFGVFLLFLYYLPIYFQVVTASSPTESGIRNLAYILSLSVVSVISGALLSGTGRYLEILLSGSVLSAIGGGLICTLDVDTPSGKWIGYQLIAGVGYGLTIAAPVVVAQGLSPPQDIAISGSVVILIQNLSGSIWVPVGQSLFGNRLIETVRRLAPGLNSQDVVGTGATDIRNVYPADVVPLVVKSFVKGLQAAFILGAAVSTASVIVLIGTFIVDYRTLKHDKARGSDDDSSPGQGSGETRTSTHDTGRE